MALLGTFISAQMGFTVTTTAGTIYTHGLGFTPEFVFLTPTTLANTGTVPIAFAYSLLTTQLVTIIASPTTSAPNVDVYCGRFHSLIQ